MADATTKKVDPVLESLRLAVLSFISEKDMPSPEKKKLIKRATAAKTAVTLERIDGALLNYKGSN